MVGENLLPGMQQWSMRLVQLDPRPESIQFQTGCRGQIPLDAKVSEEHSRSANGQRVRARGRVGGGRADMGVNNLKWQQQPGPMLDALPFEGIDPVRRQHAVTADHNAEINGAATTGATFELGLRMICQ